MAEPAPVRIVDAGAPLAWLALGWRDFLRHPLTGLIHGALVAVAGWVVLAISTEHWWLAPGAFSGFLLVGPIVATGLYELSRLDARGEPAGLADAVHAWERGTRPLIGLGFLLAGLATAWVVVSAALFALFVRVPLDTPLDFLRYAVTGQGTLLFLLWLLLGALGAALVFGLTVVSPPLLLGRAIGLRAALLTSVRAVGENPLPMGLWAGVIMLATAGSLATGMLGFLVTVPVLGHASWHAYRALVDTSGLPLRHE